MQQTDTVTLNCAAGARVLKMVKPLYRAAKATPGGPEAHLLIAIGCDVMAYVTQAVFGDEEPVVKEALAAARAWADGRGDTEKLETMVFGSLVALFHRHLPEDHQTRHLLSATESARVEASKMLSTLVGAGRYLDPDWLARIRAKGDKSNYPSEGAAGVMQIVYPRSANVLRDNAQSDKPWYEHQNDVTAIVEARLAK